MVIVYLTNGNTAQVPTAVEVSNAAEGIPGSNLSAFVCYDAQRKVVARFRTTETAGYSITQTDNETE
jgi:hypothetical protein